MTANWSIGDRITVDSRLQTLGLAARRGNRNFAITAADRQPLAGVRTHSAIPSHQLLAVIEVKQKVGKPRDDTCAIGELCGLEAVLGETVFRFHPEHGRVQGVVVALRGAVRMLTSGADLIVHDLVEIHFDETGRTKGRKEIATPTLEAADAGALVTLWDGRVVGLIVGGRGRIGYVAPVAPLLEAGQLAHVKVKRSADTPYRDFDEMLMETEAGIASFGAELAREPGFRRDELREAA